MNKTLLTFILLVFALSLSAQTGLFDIRYGMTKEQAVEHLEDEGFSVTSDIDNSVEMSPEDNYYVSGIELEFTDGVLQDWYIVYLLQEDEDIEDLVIEALVERHGDEYDIDEDMEMYYWYLGEGHWVYAGWDWAWEDFWVEYTTE